MQHILLLRCIDPKVYSFPGSAQAKLLLDFVIINIQEE